MYSADDESNRDGRVWQAVELSLEQTLNKLILSIQKYICVMTIFQPFGLLHVPGCRQYMPGSCTHAKTSASYVSKTKFIEISFIHIGTAYYCELYFWFFDVHPEWWRQWVKLKFLEAKSASYRILATTTIFITRRTSKPQRTSMLKAHVFPNYKNMTP